MFSALPLLALASLSAQDPAQVDTLRQLAARGGSRALIEHVSRYPDDAPEAVRSLLRLASRPTLSDTAPLQAAQRIAVTFADTWRDSSLLRRVSTFSARSAAERRTWAAADSLLLAGGAVLYQDGATAAIAVWRRAERDFGAIGDTAGVAAARGNIGAAFYSADQLDSSVTWLDDARRLALVSQNPRIAANATVGLGLVAATRGDLAGARARYTEALVLHQRIGDQRGVAAAHHNIGEIAETEGDLETARVEYQAALTLNRRHGHAAAAAANLEGLGNVAALLADHAEATARYAEALAVYRERDEPLNAAHVLVNLGLLETRRGDYRTAVARLAESCAIYERAGAQPELAEARRALAEARAAMGDLEGATSDLDAADRAAARADLDAVERGNLALARADLVAQFNQYAEAERAYLVAAAAYERAGDVAGRAEAQQGLALLLLRQDEPSRARDLLDLALRAEEAEGEARAAAWTRVIRASAQRELGETDGARSALGVAALTFRRLDDPVSQAAALAELGDLERDAGLPQAAEAAYREGLTVLGTRPAPAVAWRLHAGLGAALAARHADAEGAEELRLAIDAVETVAADLARPERRTAFLGDKWEVYARLAWLEQGRGRAAAAFEASERMRARQLLEMMGRGRAVSGSPRVQALADREQDLARRMLELEGGLVRPAGTRELSSTAVEPPPALVERLRREHAEVLRELERESPRMAALVATSTTRASAVAERLGPHQALLEYLVGDSTTIAFVVTHDTIVALDLNVGRRALAQQVAFVRGTIAAHADPVSRDAWRAPLRRLHRYLVAPLAGAGLLSGIDRLVIVPHAELHYLPFEALVEGAGDRFLVERYEVAYAPSAAVWTRLGERPVSAAPGTVLALAPRSAELPGSRREMETIRRVYGDRARVVVGAAATEQLLRERAGDFETVHLATFGVLSRRNPLFSYLTLGASGEDDGRLEVREVFGLELGARLVVLSACETGSGAGPLGDVPAGDEWLSLMRAFMQAGAASVVATLWPVADAETAGLMGTFFVELEGGAAPAAALTRARRQAIADPRTAHPFYWAGFVIGGGR